MSIVEKKHEAEGVRSVAIYSECEQFRYTLTRTWNRPVRRRVAFIGLNPSTATEIQNDPTVARCIQFARDWDFDEMTMLNAFAFRATDPKVMKRHDRPVGIDNDRYIQKVVQRSDLIICCWGTHATHLDRSRELLEKLEKWKCPLHCLKLTKAGLPGHPLYLKRSSVPLQLASSSQ
ncbi:DUF1643 domain-containing protein [Thalassoglobus neptunius]|nr:DUF1643 domain-containing protein [Thalassoglobus neptunius]